MRRRLALGMLIVLLVAAATAVALSVLHRGSDVGTDPRAAPPTPAEATIGATSASARARAETPPPVEKPPTRVVHGSVRSADAKPVGGAELLLYAIDPTGRTVADQPVVEFGRPLATSQSLADSTFALTATSAAGLVVVARKDGFAPAAAIVEDGKETDLVVVAGDPREFIVFDANEKPVAGALLELGGSGVVRGTATTDAAGRARVVAEEDAEILIRAAGFVVE